MPDQTDGQAGSANDGAGESEPEREPGHGAESASASVTTPDSAVPVADEAAAAAPAPVTDYTDAGVPTLDYLQDKIDKRYGTALGATELAETGDEARVQRRAAEDRERAARDRLEEIRRSLHPDED